MSTSSPDAKGIDVRFASFEARRTALQEIADSLAADENKLKEEELRLKVARKALLAKKSRIETKKNEEEMRFCEEVLDKAISSMIMLCQDQEDPAQRAKLLRRVRENARAALREVENAHVVLREVERETLRGKKDLQERLDKESKGESDEEFEGSAEDGGIASRPSFPQIPVPARSTKGPVTTSVPQKRTTTSAGFAERQQSVERYDGKN